ncbi:MAG TPA: hypothetical protein VEQ41_07440 [Solirubrobacterales bacterium]|nr:hypothetical protein [Solirubrobacterales bacterium]
MSTKLKALGLGLAAMLTIGAFGVMNAGASPTDPHRGGHFVSNAPSGVTTIIGTESPTTPNHNLRFSVDGAANGIDCVTSNYHGTMTGATAEEITVTPNYQTCYTTDTPTNHNVTVDTNGCGFLFTVNTKPTETHNAVHIHGCTKGAHNQLGIVITHPNCTIIIPQQTVTGVTYDNVRATPTSKHEVTLTSTVENITTHYAAGICVFLGTKHLAAMNGAVTVQGFDSKTGNQVDITAT